jgi:hypothetical protein
MRHRRYLGLDRAEAYAGLIATEELNARALQHSLYS